MGPHSTVIDVLGGRWGHPSGYRVVEGIYRFRCGIAWRDVPAEFGPWQIIWKRHRRYSGDGIWDKIRAGLLKIADACGEVLVDLFRLDLNGANQYGTNLPRTTEGPVELDGSDC